MNECYCCGASGDSAHIALVKVRGRRDGVRIQKNIKICDACRIWRSKEDIKEAVSAMEDWD